MVADEAGASFEIAAFCSQLGTERLESKIAKMWQMPHSRTCEPASHPADPTYAHEAASGREDARVFAGDSQSQIDFTTSAVRSSW